MSLIKIADTQNANAVVKYVPAKNADIADIADAEIVAKYPQQSRREVCPPLRIADIPDASAVEKYVPNQDWDIAV